MCANGRPGGSAALPADAIPGQQTVADDSVLDTWRRAHMRIRSTGLTLFAGLSILVAACSSTASTAPSAAAPSTAPSAAAPSAAGSTAPSEAPSVKPTSDLKIGVVTDVGKVNDKNFNQFSYAGAVNGAVSIGAKVPSVVVPTKPADWTSAKVQAESDGELFWKITNGRGPMPPWKSLPEKDRWEVVNYIKTLKK
jgi:hypothetical protein